MKHTTIYLDIYGRSNSKYGSGDWRKIYVRDILNRYKKCRLPFHALQNLASESNDVKVFNLLGSVVL